MEVILRNITEEVVLKRIDELIGTLNCCKCQQCRMDIASYALNRLPAKYVATTQGELLSKLDMVEPQYETSILTNIIQAATIVSQHPHHPKSESV